MIPMTEIDQIIRQRLIQQLGETVYQLFLSSPDNHASACPIHRFIKICEECPMSEACCIITKIDNFTRADSIEEVSKENQPAAIDAESQAANNCEEGTHNDI